MPENKIFFLGGVHGVGKSTFANAIADEIFADHLIASDLIKKQKELEQTKIVSNISSNQELLLKELNEYKPIKPNILLDGHFCLINKELEIVRLPISLYRELNISKIILLTAEPTIIFNRLNNRDQGSSGISMEKLIELQNSEIEHANYIADNLDIECTQCDSSKENSITDLLIKFKI